MVGTPMETVGWAVVSVIEKEIIEQPTQTMMASYNRMKDKEYYLAENQRQVTISSSLYRKNTVLN